MNNALIVEMFGSINQKKGNKMKLPNITRYTRQVTLVSQFFKDYFDPRIAYNGISPIELADKFITEWGSTSFYFSQLQKFVSFFERYFIVKEKYDLSLIDIAEELNYELWELEKELDIQNIEEQNGNN